MSDERRRRLRRLFFAVQVVTAVAHGVPLLALTGLLGPARGVASGALVWAFTASRLFLLGVDRRRPRWVTRFVDLPLFAHWGASLFSIPLFAVFALLAMAALPFVGPPRFDLAAGLAYGVGALLSAWAVWGRRYFVRISEIRVSIEGLDPAFSGYRIAHLTDLHVGSYDGLPQALRWAHLTNALEPDLVAVTGDLVTSGVAFYPDVAEALAALRARDGVFVSLGNHDQWDDRALARRIEARGPVVLRNAATVLRRGSAALVVAGLDDWFTGKDDLERTLKDRPLGAPTILLSHFPHFFEAATERGVDLVLSGHTHGGQIGVPGRAGSWNLARLTGQKSRGLYRCGRSLLFVNAGLGTTGPPMRLGIAPEIAILVLSPA